MYRPPSHNSTRFIDEICSFLEVNCLAGDPIILMGDFNIHMDISTDTFALKFKETLYAFSQQQHIDEATHGKGHTLDLIISRSNDGLSIVNPRVGDFISDHRVVHCSINLQKPKRMPNEKQYSKIREINIELFKKDIAQF